MNYKPTWARIRMRFRQPLSPAILAYAISGAAAFASFLATVILARSGGAALVGQYALAASTASMIATFSTFGLDWIVIREIAGDVRQGLEGRAWAKLVRIAKFVAVVSIVVAICYLTATLLTPLAALLGGDQQAMIAVTLGIVAWPLLKLGYSGIRAVGCPTLGQFFEAMPTFLFALAIPAFAYTAGIKSAGQVTVIFFAVQLIATSAAWIVLNNKMKSRHVSATDHVPVNLLAGITLMITAFLQVFSLWLLLAGLSTTTSAEELGAFRVALQIMTIPAMIAVTTESYVAPKFAGDFRASSPKVAQKRYRQATMFMIIVTGPVIIFVMIFPRLIIENIFGSDFLQASTAITIMAIGQLFNIARGPVGSVLIMSGREKFQLYTTALGIILMIFCLIILIPKFGLTGAAIAYSAPIIIRSIAAYSLVNRIFKEGFKAHLSDPD